MSNATFFGLFRSYGECCIDDVTASHAKANDLIVHFGHSCFSTETSGSDTKQIVYVIPAVAPAAESSKREWLDSLTALKNETGAQILVYADLALVQVALEEFAQDSDIIVGVPDSSKVTTIPKLAVCSQEAAPKLLGRVFEGLSHD